MPPRLLVIDFCGTPFRLLATGHQTPIKIDSGATLTAPEMVRLVRKPVDGWRYTVVLRDRPRR
jgi:hypothetical protein